MREPWTLGFGIKNWFFGDESLPRNKNQKNSSVKIKIRKISRINRELEKKF